MKKFVHTIFVALLFSATQTFALEITNNTKSSIKTKAHELENGEKVYTLTIDGKPVCLFDLFALGEMLEVSDEEILESMRKTPNFPLDPGEKAVFEYSEICSGSSQEKAIGVHISADGQDDLLFCLKLGAEYPYNQVYFAEEIEIKH